MDATKPQRKDCSTGCACAAHRGPELRHADKLRNDAQALVFRAAELVREAEGIESSLIVGAKNDSALTETKAASPVALGAPVVSLCGAPLLEKTCRTQSASRRVAGTSEPDDRSVWAAPISMLSNPPSGVGRETECVGGAALEFDPDWLRGARLVNASAVPLIKTGSFLEHR